MGLEETGEDRQDWSFGEQDEDCEEDDEDFLGEVEDVEVADLGGKVRGFQEEGDGGEDGGEDGEDVEGADGVEDQEGCAVGHDEFEEEEYGLEM